ncbi:hypothetical protein I79_026010 [Cricetulus griseus]|uniref:Uncharacterized protein n=1 Tax=Cricetulus griseus TaxID=10029 RepID=G3IPT2_CRIGR|nr:hypothetical protein I79_026010 [Cricetulus griseus]
MVCLPCLCAVEGSRRKGVSFAVRKESLCLCRRLQKVLFKAGDECGFGARWTATE